MIKQRELEPMSIWQKAFPTPRVLFPRTVGIDISDTSAKWMSISQSSVGGMSVDSFGILPLSENLIENGDISDAVALGRELSAIRSHVDTPYAHVSLPEELGYTFSIKLHEGVPASKVAEFISKELESRVPIRLDNAIYDVDVMHGDEVVVCVFPADIIQKYTNAMTGAGFVPVSFENEFSAMARAVVSDGVALIIDIGRNRAGCALVHDGVVILTSTLSVSGEAISEIIMNEMQVSYDDAENIKRINGLDDLSVSLVSKINTLMTPLTDEVLRIIQYWENRVKTEDDTLRILLMGGCASMHGIEAFISSRIKHAVSTANIWSKVCDNSLRVPPIDKQASYVFATSLGLALRSYHL